MKPFLICGLGLIVLGFLGAIVLDPKSFQRERAGTSGSQDQEHPIVRPSALGTQPPALAQVRMDAVTPGMGRKQGISEASESDKAALLKRKAVFFDLAMREDRASLNLLLGGMQDLNRDVRKAALEAVVQFDDRSSIPRLQVLATQADDFEEKNRILAAIEYMKLPSLHEYLAEQRSQRVRARVNISAR